MEIQPQLPETFIFGQFTITRDTERCRLKITRRPKTGRAITKLIVSKPFLLNRTPDQAIAAMDVYITSFIKQEQGKQEAKNEKKQRLKAARATAKNPYTSDDILYHCWGYDQTNVDFYQVVSVKDMTIKIRPIDQQKTVSGSDRGTTLPIKDTFTGEEQTRRIQVAITTTGTRVYVKQLSKWDGRPVHWTGYC